MNTTQIFEILAQATKLTLEEQYELNKLLVENIKRARTVANIKAAVKFNLGDTVVFDAKSKGIVKITISGFSRDGSKLKGAQIGGFRPGCLWTVSANVCKAA